MNPVQPDRADRRVPLYFFFIVAVILASLFFAFWVGQRSGAVGDDFSRLMNLGQAHYEKGETARAIEAFQKAVALQPTHPDALLNLANAHLLAGQSENAVIRAREVLSMNNNEAAAHYLIGCANVRLRKFEEGIKALQQAKDIDRKINAVSFQLGRAHLELGHFQDAADQFAEILQFEPEYPAANFYLGQALVRLGRQEEAKQAFDRHQQLLAGKPNPPADASTYERCIYTQARVPFQLEQPARDGIKVTFTDATQTAFGEAARNFHGPIGVLDINHRGQNDLFVREGDGQFRLLLNAGGTFKPQGEPIPAKPGARYMRCLVGDVNNDRYEDVVVLGDQGVHLFKFATNGAISDFTRFARLNDASAVDGVLADLDFTGKLDLLLVTPGTGNLRVFRNLASDRGNPYFKDVSATSGVPVSVTGISRLALDDWNNDDMNDLLLVREGQPPQVLIKQRGGGMTETNAPANWPAAKALAAGDLNNDLRNDVVVATPTGLECIFGALTNRIDLPSGDFRVNGLTLVDYDNDGWLDLCAHGEGARIWRNLGSAGFRETTRELGLNKVTGAIEAVAAADFDMDGDTDLLLGIEQQGLRLLRNDGGSANQQLKLRLIGNRSNASGLGVRVEVVAGRWRTLRTVTALPVEIGTGKYGKLDSVTAHWFDAALPVIDAQVDSRQQLALLELQLPTGSCPYLYAWGGKRFRFVTDLLGASPAGLPVAQHRFVDADPDEFVWVGEEAMFPPRDGHYLLQITEELREVLYLDAAHLVVVDHPEGTEVHTTGKLLPGKPFPPHEIITLRNRRPLKQAFRSDGGEVTERLNEADDAYVSPVQLRVPQLRGLAEPWGVTLDFGPLPTERPLALALTGWLRYGGGMANVAASHDPHLPFPFPTLEVETGDGKWQPVDVVVGAPAGKTKSMVVELTDKLPRGSKRLRLTTAFEIHWDRIALLEKDNEGETKIARLVPDSADLHWRGFSEHEALPWYLPLTPDYDEVYSTPRWRITPMGWCTRYGDVRELIEHRDNALALLNGGDELTLKFATDRLPPRPAGQVRDFFFYSSGWDKDSDFHCAKGWLVEPLPWHGMDDQIYGQQERPVIDGDWWIRKYNTRWVGPLTLKRKE